MLLFPVLLAGSGGRQARSEPLQSVTASDCKSSNAKVLFGAVRPHGFSLSTLQKGGEQGRSGQSINANELKWSSQLSLDQESWEMPAVDTCYFLAEQRSPREGRAGSALLPSPLQKKSGPAFPSDPTSQGRGKRPHAEGWCTQRVAELPALELQVQCELQSQERQAATGIVSSPHRPPSLSTHFELFLLSIAHAIPVVYQPEARGKFTCLPSFPQTPWRPSTTQEREGEAKAQERHMQAESRQEAAGSRQAGSHLVGALGRVLDAVLLQQAQVQEPFPAPHALVLLLPGMHAVVLVEVLTLLEGLLAGGALVGLLSRVHAPVALQVRGVLEPLFTVGALEGLLAGRVAAVLHELGGGKETSLAECALERLLGAVGQLVLLQS